MLKHEKVHPKSHASAPEARREVGDYFRFYNKRCLHQVRECRTPARVFHGARNKPEEESKLMRNPRERVLES